MTQSTTAPRRPRTARPRLDAVTAEAVELAHQALLKVTEPGQVGEHLRVEASGERLVTHVFECTMPGYRGWSWVVVLARAARAKAPTVAETALLPGEEAILAPEWEPWSERLKPEDIGADDLLPFHEQDERLEQGYEATGDEDADRVALWELGLGRPRVLSPQGRADAAERWVEGEFGPRQTSDRGRRGTVSATCTSCGFLSQLSGSLRGEFGVCTNEWSPADGKVVHLDFGCGAHSETGQEDNEREIKRPGAISHEELDVDVPTPAGADAEPAAAESPAAEKSADAVAVTTDDAAATEAAAAVATDEAGAAAATLDEIPEADSAADEAPADAVTEVVPAADATEDTPAAGTEETSADATEDSPAERIQETPADSAGEVPEADSAADDAAPSVMDEAPSTEA